MAKPRHVPPLSEEQKHRLRWLSGAVTRALQDLHQAQINEQHDELYGLSLECARADVAYSKALRLRAFQVGDVVRVVLDGPYKGRESTIREVRIREVEFLIEDTTVVAKPHEIELVTPA